jgi:hypothetical protein
MLKKDGEIKLFKDKKLVSPKVADDLDERYTIDDLVNDSKSNEPEQLTFDFNPKKNKDNGTVE